MITTPRFVRFTSPFWFGLQGYFDEQDGTIVDTDDTGRSVLVSIGAVNPAVPYVGVVHSGSVLPVTRVNKEVGILAVMLPAPWSEEQDGLPFGDPDVIVAAAEQGEPPRIEEVSQARARELFPDHFNSLTQEDLDRWAAEDGL